ncbi:MAG: trypsin-like peptidase domain-containing protein [Firmicutes bacterium]|nr:trypsin-like peptidase domain-containing protein [Bacillota bacterium]
MKKKPSFLKTGIACILVGSVIGTATGIALPLALNAAKASVETALRQSASAADEALPNKEEKAKSEENISAHVEQLMDQASKDTVNIIKAVKPSVVCITSVLNTRDFFNQYYQNENSGSGIIFHEDDKNVYIVTNCSVVSGASSVKVSVSDSDLVSAYLVGKDNENNLAVISVSKEDLLKVGITGVTCATFADSSKTEVGETVIAIGNALGEGNTATKGIISSSEKDLKTNLGALKVFQTDAAINPGNDGGALVNSDGLVVGINTTKVTSTSVEGVGYAITSNAAKPVIEALMNSEEAPALGIIVETISEDVATQAGLPKAGVYVREVVKDGAAAAAGVQVGDIITSYNNTPVFDSNALIELIKKSKVGDTVEVTVYRDGQTKVLKAILKRSSSF